MIAINDGHSRAHSIRRTVDGTWLRRLYGKSDWHELVVERHESGQIAWTWLPTEKKGEGK